MTTMNEERAAFEDCWAVRSADDEGNLGAKPLRSEADQQRYRGSAAQGSWVWFQRGQIDAILAQPAQQGEAVEVLKYWFIGDAGLPKGRRTCKKSLADGSLAFFESEFDAKRACRRHPGTEVYPVEFMTIDQHQRILAARGAEGCKVVPVELIERTICRLTHGHEHDKAVRELRALLVSAEGVKDE